MSKGMDTLHDLIEEAKKRTLVWVVCILGLSYCLSLTSNMVWLNIPISFLIISGIRYLSFEVELQRRSPAIPQPSYLYHLHRRQLSPDDPLLLPPLVTVQWKRNIDSPVVEAAADEFTRKIVQEFVTDLWYSSITPDQEFPEQICLLINDVLGEISQRIKRVNLIDLLTRDMVDLIGSHLELYRRNQAHIGVDVMGILSSEERDERLKHCLASARELHPALISSEEEYKVLQRLMGGLVAVVLRPQDAECPLVRCLVRELLACAVIQPVMSFASPGSINEIIEFVVLASKDTSKEEAQNKKLDKEELADVSHSKSAKEASGRSMFKDGLVSGSELMETGEGGLSSKDRNSSERDNYGARGPSSSYHDSYLDPQLKVLSALQSRPADWAQLLESIRQRRTQVLAPENLDNLWTKGRNYRQKDISKDHAKLRPSLKSSVLKQDTEGTVKQEGVRQMHEQPIQWEDAGNSTSMELLDATGGTKTNIEQMMFGSTNYLQDSGRKAIQDTDYSERDLQVRNQSFLEKEVSKSNECQNFQVRHKRSKSGGTVFEGWQKVDRSYFPEGGENWDSKKLWGSKSGEAQSFPDSDNPSVIVWPQTGIAPVPKLKCWVLGAHFEKVGSKSFAVYSIAVTNTENKTWFVDRRYRNFEQLHRRLRDIPNYALQLPPKRFLSSSLDDYFVQQRCILLDKYLKDLLSIPNIAEQHEVWDFLSATSKNYSFGKSPSVMKTLAVNVDDAVDDIVRQFKEVSDGLRRRVAGVSSSSEEIPTAPKDLHMKSSWTSEAAMTNESNWDSMDRFQSLSDVEEGVGDRWHSDSELQIQPFPSQPIVRPAGEPGNSDLEKLLPFERRVERLGSDGCSTIDSLTGSDIIEDEFGMPPEWSPPKLSVPLLNLVDNIFQLQQRGWLRRQVFWISKQILQLIMEDAIDDWLLRQIQWLRRDDIIALGIRWVQDVLWPNGVFISKGNTQRQIENAIINNPNGLTTTKENHGKILAPTSFEEQLEAARKASFVHDILFGGVPSALVSLIGGKQYRHCVNNIFFFLQSSVCVKQLAYSLLELLLITVFPELRELVLDIHGKTSLNSKCFVLPS